MASPESVVYLFHGDDEPVLKDKLTSFCDGVFKGGDAMLNTTRIEGKEISKGDIDSAAGTLPFLADVRLVLVENLTASSTGREIVKDLATLIAGLPDWARLVFYETGIKGGAGDSQADQNRRSSRRAALKKMVKIVEDDPRGHVFSFAPPKKGESPAWIVKRAKVHGTSIDPNAARELAQRTNNDLMIAENELIKLATYVNYERMITIEDVRQLTPNNFKDSIFTMVDALGRRDGRMAISVFHNLLDGIKDQQGQAFSSFGMIVRQYRLLIQVREQLDGKGTRETVGIKSDWQYDKMSKQARLYRLEQLERIYAFLLEIDLDIKQGRLTPKLGIETFIARLSK